jgi:3-hydroxypropanoate dehydrogenase
MLDHTTAAHADASALAPDSVNDRMLDLLFREARTPNGFLAQPVEFAFVQRAYDLARMGPTSMNCQPMRLVLLSTPDAKERLVPALSPGNVEKTRQAPLTAIIAQDLRFFERLPELFPHKPDAATMFVDNPALAEETAFRNSTLQGAYFMLALRTLGLDAGSMSGFNRARVDAEFFPDSQIRSNWLINIGKGDQSKLFPRGPRLAFDEAVHVL